MRQLFILNTSLSVHRCFISSENYSNILTRRIIKLQNVPINTSFAKRFVPFIATLIYNKILHLCDIKQCSVVEAKFKITKWLKTLSYDSTEQILVTIS